MINYIKQPENSNLCGQTCIAMLAGITLEESIKAFGTKGATKTEDLVIVLRSLGISCGDKLIKLKNGEKKPDICIVKLHFKTDKHTHWTIWNKDHYLDPGMPLYIVKYPEDIAWETSYLPIYQ